MADFGKTTAAGAREARIREAEDGWPDADRDDLAALVDRAEGMCRVGFLYPDRDDAGPGGTAHHWRWVDDGSPTLVLLDRDGVALDILGLE